MKYRAALASNDWIVDYNEVHLYSGENAQSSVAFRSMVSLASDQMKKKYVCHYMYSIVVLLISTGTFV